MTYAENELLPLSGLQHLVFCERQAALIHLEQQWADDAKTVSGEFKHRSVHETAPRRERRGSRIVVRGLVLQSTSLGIAGVSDVVEFHEATSSYNDELVAELPGTLGVWRPYPIEYKLGRPKSHQADEVQLCAQALCLEEMLHLGIPEGALFYGREQRRVSVGFDDVLRDKTIRASKRFHEIVESEKTPPATKSKKCDFCSLNALCIPGVATRRGSVRRYLGAALHDILDHEESGE